MRRSTYAAARFLPEILTQIDEIVACPAPRLIRWRTPASVAGALLLAALGLASMTSSFLHMAEPRLRQRVIADLSARFHSPVELDELHVSLVHGLRVSGGGLRIRYLAGPTKPDADPHLPPPMLSVGSFHFHLGWGNLLHPFRQPSTVFVERLQVDIPPHPTSGPAAPDDPGRRGQPAASFVDKVVCTDCRLVIETSEPGKDPLVFDMPSLTITTGGPATALRFEAVVTNPKPIGDLAVVGTLGPWQQDNPANTALEGSYAFKDADLSSVPGLSGLLSGETRFSGSLADVRLQGTVSSGDFRMDVSERPIAIHAEFTGAVSNRTGDIQLSSVTTKFLGTILQANGTCVRRAADTHDLQLIVSSTQARVEDLLLLGVKTSPPLTRGALTLRTRLEIPPGEASISRKMRLAGDFRIAGATFSNKRFQEDLDRLSLRAQGRKDEAKASSPAVVGARIVGTFTAANSLVRLHHVIYTMPALRASLDGRYSLDESIFEFGGNVHTDATASEMMSGIKGILARPLDPLLHKHGSGLDLPVKIEGPRSSPRIHVDLGKLGVEALHSGVGR